MIFGARGGGLGWGRRGLRGRLGHSAVRGSELLTVIVVVGDNLYRRVDSDSCAS